MMDNDTATDGPAGSDSAPGPGLRASLGAIFLVVDEPVAGGVLAQVLERPREEIALEIRELAASYDAEGRGFDLREVAGGWRFYTPEEGGPVGGRVVRDGPEVRLTQAALGTLAGGASRQPGSPGRGSGAVGSRSRGLRRWPASRPTWAIPAPIVPAPTTPISIVGSGPAPLTPA